MKRPRKKQSADESKTPVRAKPRGIEQSCQQEVSQDSEVFQRAPSGAPNVIFVLTDDLGYSDISCYGAKKVKTRHLNRIASEGMMFTDFHTAASICLPSRAAFLTGAYPQRAGPYMGINPKRKAHWGVQSHQRNLGPIAKTGYVRA
ncbi:MAG: sulfatase-like hydrolase/transferase [Verrucomicrobiota bacterium]